MGYQDYKHQILDKVMIALLFAFSPTIAFASVITVSQGLALNQTYGDNSSSLAYSSVFDAASALGTANFDADYIVNSAVVHFDWVDNSNDPFTLWGSSGWSYDTSAPYILTSSYNANNYYTKYVTGTASEFYSAPSESAGLAFGTQGVSAGPTLETGTTSSASVNTFSHFYGGHGPYSSGYYSYPGEWYYWSYTNTLRKYYTDFSGSFDLDVDLLALGGDALNSFLLNGTLPFTMTMNGDAVLSDAYLTLDISRTSQSNLTNGVSEPATLALLAMGLFGMIGSQALRTGRHGSENLQGAQGA